MRSTALVIAVILASSALLPLLQVDMEIYADTLDNALSIRTDDVCHSSSGKGGLSNITCLLCPTANPFPLQSSGIAPAIHEPSLPAVIIPADERPPQLLFV